MSKTYTGLMIYGTVCISCGKKFSGSSSSKEVMEHKYLANCVNKLLVNLIEVKA